MNKALSMFMLVLILAACTPNPTGQAVKESAIVFSNETFPSAIAELQPLNLNTVERYEDYKLFADRTNTLIDILNREMDYDIPLFPDTREAWAKASITITKYSPLINNYNEVVRTAKMYSQSESQEAKKTFYIASGRFGFEAGLIVWAVFYSAAYESVGVVYRSIGLNSMAFEHPVIVKTILSNWHWLLRNTLVETASQTATATFNKSLDLYDNIGGIDGIRTYAGEAYHDSKDALTDFVDRIG